MLKIKKKLTYTGLAACDNADDHDNNYDGNADDHDGDDEERTTSAQSSWLQFTDLYIGGADG